MEPPSIDQFRKGYMAFQQHERRDAMYKTATFLVVGICVMSGINAT
jgi:hypothetical protein